MIVLKLVLQCVLFIVVFLQEMLFDSNTCICKSKIFKKSLWQQLSVVNERYKMCQMPKPYKYTELKKIIYIFCSSKEGTE